MGSSVAGGRYRVTWRENQWVVRGPDGRTVAKFGPKSSDRADAGLRAERMNEKLRAIEQK